MDKQEYRTKLDEAKRQIAEGDKEEAFYILDGMNWRRVHNVNALISAATIYEDEGRLSQAKELLELAHERSPIGRAIIYRLALLCIQLEEYDEAKEYYNEFVEIAPHDSQQYIIQYKIAKAEGADTNTLISILEELKKRDFLEEWAYELALLYHKIGRVQKCIEVCDEIILWYGDGPYVEGALELKLLYQPLDEGQQSKYKDFLKRRDGITEVRPGDEFGGNGEILSSTIEIPEIALNTDPFNTQNLQDEIRKNIQEIMNAKKAGQVSENMEAIKELVEDIPYAKPKKEDTGPLEELSIKKEEGRKIDDTLRNHFKEYLKEEQDGQMSLSLPDSAGVGPKAAGQMTIDKIMSDWQKTARAAEQALSEADELRLENVKARAIEEANRIIQRLEQAKKRLDAGVAPKDLLKDEYMSDLPSQGEELKQRFSALKKQLGAAEEQDRIDRQRQEVLSQDTTFIPAGARAAVSSGAENNSRGQVQNASRDELLSRRYATKRIDKPDPREREALKNQSTFKIKRLDAQTGRESGVGFEVPIMDAEEAREQDPAARAKKLSRDANKVFSDVNRILQQEIDRATGRLPSKEELERGLSKDQTQAFAEAVVRTLNEQARRNEEEKRSVGFETMSRFMLTEVETGTALKNNWTPTANNVPVEIETGTAKNSDGASKDAGIAAAGEQSINELAKARQEAVAAEAASKKEIKSEGIVMPVIPAELSAKKPQPQKVEEPPKLPESSGSEEPPKLSASSGESAPVPRGAESGNEPEFVTDEKRLSTGELPTAEDLAKHASEDLPRVELYEIETGDSDDIGYKEEVDASRANGRQEDSYNEIPQTELSPEEKEKFSYFTPIIGMEETLCQVLSRERARLLSDKPAPTGNILIQGGEGSGKTTLAKSLISVLEMETGKPDGNVGKIDAVRLNTKDMSKLFGKIRGGALIIEKAGEISRETALELSAQMEADRSGIIIILEDGKLGIERVMALNPVFSRRFTEKIVIPILSMDELVNFGDTYAKELGYAIDEVANLALYDRINLVNGVDHPANLNDVKAIVDEAIDIAEGGGFRGFLGRFGGRHYDDAGNLILQEKDFRTR